jgi:hypothetical protein
MSDVTPEIAEQLTKLKCRDMGESQHPLAAPRFQLGRVVMEKRTQTAIQGVRDAISESVYRAEGTKPHGIPIFHVKHWGYTVAGAVKAWRDAQ